MIARGALIDERPHAGWLTGGEFEIATGMNERRRHHWNKAGVFGRSLNPGSGNRIYYSPAAIPVCRVLMAISRDLSSSNPRNGPPTRLLRRVVECWDAGQVAFGPHVSLHWDTEEQ